MLADRHVVLHLKAEDPGVEAQGLRLIIEMIEELVLRGGGNGLFHGCAAGDTAMATVVSVRDTRN